MSKFKTAMAGTLLGVGAMASGQAMADLSASLNITSEYMFRGIESSSGGAVQGSLDWSSPTGIYAGAWASNAAPLAGETELDVYVGWATELSQGLGLDVGIVYYAFPEQEETGANSDLDYAEIYGGLSFGGLSGSIYYTDDYFGTDEDGVYYTVAYSLALSDTVDLGFQIGFNDGDGVEAAIGDEYTDWSITLSKDLGDGWGASFGYVQTDLDLGPASPLGELDDDPKFVVSASKEFSI